MADTTHWSSTPSIACTAIISDLQTNLGAFVPSIKRISHDTNLEIISNGLNSGLPGVLLFYGAGPLKANSTMQQEHTHEMAFRLLCCSGHFESFYKRQVGTGEMDIDQVTAPGVEELQDFVYRFAARALNDVDGVCRVKVPRFNPAREVLPGLYIGTVDLTATREINIWDDSITTTLESLGMVFDPNDTENIWSDPPTDLVPDSFWTGHMGGGAEFDLPED